MKFVSINEKFPLRLFPSPFEQVEKSSAWVRERLSQLSFCGIVCCKFTEKT
jgi:hypothetical protein